MKLNPKYIQLIGELAIPLSGYFFWDWGLYFILLFYLIDIFAGEVIIHLKSKKIVEFNGKGKNSWILSGLASAILLVVSLLGIHLAMIVIQPGIEFKTEIIAFWTETDMGMQQGYFLVPLVGFVAYLQYKMTFLTPARYRSTQLTTIWKRHYRSFFIIIAGAGIATGIAQFVVIPELIYVLTIAGASSTYQFFLKD